MTLRSFIILLLSSIVLAGCSSVPESVTSVEWQAHKQRLETIDNFQATGKFGYIGPYKRQSLNFFWKHSSDLSQLRLTTLLGQTTKPHTPSATVETYDDRPCPWC